MALHNVRDPDNFAHTHRVCGHMSNSAILWHRSHSKNANFSDADAAKVRPICKACAYGEQRQTRTDSNRVHRPLPTVPGQSFSIDAYSCTHRSIRGFDYHPVQESQDGNRWLRVYIWPRLQPRRSLLRERFSLVNQGVFCTVCAIWLDTAGRRPCRSVSGDTRQ